MLEEGDIIELKEGHMVYFKIPEHFVYQNRRGSFDRLTSTEIMIGENKNGMDTDFLKGRYAVTSTSTIGGGTGHGPHDTYPDGHFVVCEKLEDDCRCQISFYQSGCFTAMIEDIEPVGKAKATWNEEQDDT